MMRWRKSCEKCRAYAEINKVVKFDQNVTTDQSGRNFRGEVFSSCKHSVRNDDGTDFLSLTALRTVFQARHEEVGSERPMRAHRRQTCPSYR